MSQDQDQVCEFCKLAGAPDFVCKFYMSGGAGQQKTTVKEYKLMEKKLFKELKKLPKKKKVDSDN